MRISRLSTVIIVAFGALSLSGCFGSSDADKVLQRMHEAYVAQIEKNAHLLERPDVGRTHVNMLLKIFSIEERAIGAVDLAVDLTALHDLRNEQSPLVSMETDINAVIGIPSQGRYTLETTIGTRSTDRTLLLNIAKLVVEAPTGILPVPFALPAAMQTVWYGATFQELNRIMRDNAQDGETAPSVELMIRGVFGGTSVHPDDLRTMAKKLHLWKGLEVLPEGDGLVHVRVESDKKKIRDSVRAIVSFMEKSAGSSWKASMKNNTEFQTMVRNLEKNDSEFMREMGTVKGVISADKDTYTLRGFEGDIFDTADTLVGRIAYRSSGGGDFMLRFTEEESGDAVLLTKEGAKVDLIADGKQIITGSVSSEKVSLLFLGEEDGSVAHSVTFDIASYDEATGSFRIENGIMTMVNEGITVDIAHMTVERQGVNTSFSLEAAGTRDGNELFTITIDSEQNEADSFTPEKPSYKPFESLQQDLMQALLGGADLP